MEPRLVEAYLRYQQSLLAQPRPGRSPGRKGRSPGWESLRDEALAEERALASAALSEENLEVVEPLVLAVLAKLRVEQAAGVASTMAVYEQIRAKLPPAKQVMLEPILAELRGRATKLRSLEAERARFGNAGVEAVLARKEALMAAQGAWLARSEPP